MPDEGCGLGLQPPSAGKGFQVCSKGTEIGAMEDVEYCEVVTLPGTDSDTYYVNRIETQMTDYSHHLIILSAEPGSSSEAKMPDGKRVSCIGGEQAFGRGLSPVTGSQRPYSDAAFPAGVGKIYHGGQRLSFDYHYFNVTGAPVSSASSSSSAAAPALMTPPPAYSTGRLASLISRAASRICLACGRLTGR